MMTMKKPSRFLACFLFGSWLLSPVAVGQPRLIWSEEFDSTVPDPEVWSFDLGNTNNGWYESGELQDYTTENVQIVAGSLYITAQKNDTTGVFTSSRLTTQKKILFQYGTLEASIQIPDTAAGLWPALWTLGADIDQVGWPTCGQYHVMEVGQGTAIDQGLANRRVYSDATWSYFQKVVFGSSFDASVDLNGGYHVYSMDWTPQNVSTFLDGQLIWTLNIDPTVSCEDCDALHQPHFILLSLAVGGGFTSSGRNLYGSAATCEDLSSTCPPLRTADDITAPLPAVMKVDYLRLYDNGYTNLLIPISAIATDTTAPVPAPVTLPVSTPVPAPFTAAPVISESVTGTLLTPPPTVAPTPVPTLAPVAVPLAMPVLETVSAPATAPPTTTAALRTLAPAPTGSQTLGGDALTTSAPLAAPAGSDGIIFNRPNRQPSAPSGGGPSGKGGSSGGKGGSSGGKGGSSGGKGECSEELGSNADATGLTSAPDSAGGDGLIFNRPNRRPNRQPSAPSSPICKGSKKKGSKKDKKDKKDKDDKDDSEGDAGGTSHDSFTGSSNSMNVGQFQTAGASTSAAPEILLASAFGRWWLLLLVLLL